MKHAPILAAIVLGIVLLIQSGSNAGPGVTPRTVPIIVQGVMQPSKMVAVSILTAATQNQLQVPLQAGQVFVVTSWTVNGNSDGQAFLTEGPSVTFETIKDSLFILFSGNMRDVQHVFSTGIRFPEVGGLADAWVGGPGSAVTVSVQGYITDDF